MQKKRIGLIAGNGQFPIIFSSKARAKGFSIYAVAYIHEADTALADYTDAIEWMHLGQIRRLIKFFRGHEVHEAVMVGGIRKTRIFTDVRPDIKAITLIAGMKSTHDDGLLRTFAGVLEREGIRVRASTFLLPELLAEKGCWTRREPSRSEKADIDVGWNIAKQIGNLDIGQCVVVGGGSVLAVEAVDGTDATIVRGGSLGRGNAVVIKVCKPKQDTRFDMPAIGVQTIRTMQAAKARVLAVEAGRSVVFDRQEMIGLADQAGISIVALEGD